jgi:hypothetical protein
MDRPVSETSERPESSRHQSVRAVETIDLSTALRIKGVLNWIRNIGFVLGSFLLLLSIADRRLILVVGVVFAAHVMLARGSRTAAAILVLLALFMALYFEQDYREAFARVRDRPSVETGGPLDATVDSGIRSLIGLNRKLAWFCLGLGAAYLGAFVLTASYRRRALTPRSNLDWRRRLALRVAFLRARMTPKAVCYGALTLLCVLVVLAPALAMLPALLLHVPRTELTGPVLDRAFSAYDWWRVMVTFALVIASLYFWTRAKRHAALALNRAKAIDVREPILLLRSFGDDTTPLERTSDQRSWMRSVVSPAIWTLEETIEQILGDHGPVIAIGRPGESVPPTGAAREYLDGDRWQKRVEELIGEARLVAVILGETEGLRFEYEALLRLGVLQRMILVVPPRQPEELSLRWRRLCEVFAVGHSIPTVDLSRALAAHVSPEGVMTLVTCYRRNDEDCYRLALNYSLAAIMSSSLRPTSP